MQQQLQSLRHDIILQLIARARVLCFRQLMIDYVSRVQRLVKHDGTRYVLTKDAVRYASPGGPLPQAVWFVDNPGDQEQRERLFLVGIQSGRVRRAGVIGRKVFEAVFGPNYRDHVLILNKSNYHTSSTKELPEKRARMNPEDQQRFDNDMKSNAQLACDLATTLTCPIIVAGTDNFFKKCFFEVVSEGRVGIPTRPAIYDGREVTKSIQVVPHFSYYSSFKKSEQAEQWNQGWNQRVDDFLASLGAERKMYTTPSGRGISYKTIDAISKVNPDKAARLLKRYFCEVLLGVSSLAPEIAAPSPSPSPDPLSPTV